MKIFYTTVQWLVILAAAYFALFGFRFSIHLRVLPEMPFYLVIPFSLSIAFVWVDVLKIGVTKPFTCVKCMTAWVAVIIAYLYHVPFWYFYLPVGLFAGAIFSAVKMRWL